MSNNEEITEAKIVAYLNQELSAVDALLVDTWVTQSEANRNQFNTIKKTWSLLGSTTVKAVAVDTDKAWNNVFATITEKSTPVVPLHSPQLNTRKFLLIAAGFALLVGLTTLFFWPSGIVPNVELTAQDKVIHQNLSDGSAITLNTNSVLTYPAEFENNERRVKLTGEAFFDIARDEERPFVIDLHDNYYVKVLGTSFNVKSITGDSITEVYVKTGKVEFGSSTEKIILEAGEKGVLNNHTGQLQKITEGLSLEAETFWLDQHIIFESTPLVNVINRLNLVYDDEVVLACDDLSDEAITSEFKGQSLLEILEVIAEVHQLTIVSQKTNLNWEYTLKCDD